MRNEGEHSIEKFAFIGSESVGKSTMTGIFRNRFANNPRVAILEEGAHLFFLSHPDLTDRSARVQKQIQDFVLAREQEAYRPGIKLIMSDRSVIDPIVYAQVYDTAENAARLLGNVADWLSTYTSFALLDPSGVPHDMGPFRKETDEERLVIHNAFGEFCIKNNLPFVEISGSLQERANRVEKILHEQVRDKTIFENSNHGSWTNQI